MGMAIGGAPAASSSTSRTWRMVLALSMVSAVVKVLETMITRVSSASSPEIERSTSTGSTFERKRRVKPWEVKMPSLSVASTSLMKLGPRYDPPIPTDTMFLMGRPVAPTICPARTFSVNSLMRSSCSWTCGVWRVECGV